MVASVMSDLMVIGYCTLQFSWGGLIARLDPEPPWSETHLVVWTGNGTPGPTLCGIDRFSEDPRRPGWSVAGGVSGPMIPVVACDACTAARQPDVPVIGLNHEAFGPPGRPHYNP